MKIRTDFVTNSSSSSFILSLRFDLKNGKTILWEGASDCGEGAHAYYELSARKSPQALGECENIDCLVDMVKQYFGEGTWPYVEAFEDFNDDDYDNFKPIFDDDSKLIKSLRRLRSMDEISKITVEGYEDTFNDWDGEPEAFDDIVSYDMESKQQTAIGIGTRNIESEGTGGALDFNHETKIEPMPEGYFEQKRKSPVFRRKKRT